MQCAHHEHDPVNAPITISANQKIRQFLQTPYRILNVGSYDSCSMHHYILNPKVKGSTSSGTPLTRAYVGISINRGPRYCIPKYFIMLTMGTPEKGILTLETLNPMSLWHTCIIPIKTLHSSLITPRITVMVIVNVMAILIVIMMVIVRVMIISELYYGVVLQDPPSDSRLRLSVHALGPHYTTAT